MATTRPQHLALNVLLRENLGGRASIGPPCVMWRPTRCADPQPPQPV